MTFNRQQRKLYEHLKQINFEAQPGRKSNAWMRKLSLELNLGLRGLRTTLKILKSHGLLGESFKVPENLYRLKLSQVSLRSGGQMLKEKEQRRREFFESHGSMRLPIEATTIALKFEARSPIDWT